MKSFYLTDSGRVRSHNEDSVTIVKNQSGEHLMMVADGMGGHRAGEVASSMVVTHLGSRFSNLSTIGTKFDAVNWLNENINTINTNIIKYTEENPELTGMGTTIVLALLTKDFLIFGNMLVEAGEIKPEEAANHPKKNVLMKALGTEAKQVLDIFDVDMNIDAIMLCSDGLTNMLTVEQIEKVLNESDLKIEDKLIKIIKKCNARGGTDNISIAYLLKEGE